MDFSLAIVLSFVNSKRIPMKNMDNIQSFRNEDVVQKPSTTEVMLQPESSYANNINISPELIVEVMKKENQRSAIQLELEKNRGLELEVRDRESKNAETVETRKLEEAQTEKIREESKLLKQQQKNEEQLKQKAFEDAEKVRISEQNARDKEKQEEFNRIRQQAKTEIKDLRDFGQRQLLIKSLDCNNDIKNGAFHVSQMLEKNIVWAQFPLTASDGFSVTALALSLGHNTTVKIADLIEPQVSNSIATVTIRDNFFININTPLRGGEEYKVHFTPDDIVQAIRKNKQFKQDFTTNLINYLSEPSYNNTEVLKTFQTELQQNKYISADTDFVQMVHDKIGDKQHTQLEDMVKESMSEFHCEMIKGKPTFLDTKGITYTASSLIQMFAGKEHQIEIQHPLTKKVSRFNPAKLYIDENMYSIYHGNIFYPATYTGKEFNNFQGFKYTSEKMMYISHFIEFVNKVGCDGNKQVSQAFWSYFAKIIQGDVHKYSALAIVSDEDELVNLLLKPFRQIMESFYFRVSDKKQLTDVNTVFKDKVLVEIDDDFLSTKGAMIELESLIKNTNFSYQTKKGIYETKPNYSSCIITSSNHNLVSKLAKKRMFIVVEIANNKADDYDYLDEIQQVIDDERFAPSLMYYLNNYKVQKDLLKRPSLKSFTNEEIEEGFSIELKWFYKRLQSGDFSNVASEPRDNFGIRLSSDGLYKDFISYSKSIGEPSTMVKSTLGAKISKILKPHGLIKAGQLSQRTGNAVDYSSLPECRIAFEKYTGLSNPNWTSDTWIVNKS